jgi:hypothetical protein
MPFDFLDVIPENIVPQSIVPENNLRLPDALTIKHGPARLLSPFVLSGDRAVRQAGVHLRIRHDFDELVYFNRQNARNSWYPLLDAFNPQCVELTPENAFWLSGEDETGEIVLTRATRIYNWTGTNLAEQARALWYGRDLGQPCIVTADAAELITGIACEGGAFWVRPDFRGRHLSHLVPKIGKAYACTRWPIDWLFCYIGTENVNKGLAANYGYKHLSYSVFYPESTLGEQVVAYTAVEEFYADIASASATGRPGAVLEEFDTTSLPRIREHIVTKTSPDGVFHGSISRS